MEQLLDKTAAVRPGEELDAGKLREYIAAHLPEIAGDIVIEQFPSGYSNLTYLVRVGGEEYVLRRPPFGNRVQSAHDVGREYRVLSKLNAVYELAPRPVLHCEDDSVLGAPFYLMERRKGIILRRDPPRGLDLSPDTMRRLSENLVDNLARLHSLDYVAAGLGDLGRPEGFVERQVAGWTKRYHAAATSEVAAMNALAVWLADHQPRESGSALIHNDYKFDNLVLDPADPTRITAVLDWEMCTIGDPLMDLGCSLAYWVEAGDEPALKAFVAGPTDRPGALTRREIVDRYTRTSGRDVSDILFYYCYGLFKLAVIVQQIYYRFAQGHTRDPRFAQLDKVVASLGIAGMHAVERGAMP